MLSLFFGKGWVEESCYCHTCYGRKALSERKVLQHFLMKLLFESGKSNFFSAILVLLLQVVASSRGYSEMKWNLTFLPSDPSLGGGEYDHSLLLTRPAAPSLQKTKTKKHCVQDWHTGSGLIRGGGKSCGFQSPFKHAAQCHQSTAWETLKLSLVRRSVICSEQNLLLLID